MVSAFILSCFLFIIVLAVASYGLSILSVSETLMYVIFKNKSDDDYLLDRKDEDESEDGDDPDFDTTDDSDIDNQSDNTNEGDASVNVSEDEVSHSD